MADGPEGGAAGELHPRLRDAARGLLPEWARVDEERRAHLERVAELLERWARSRGEPEEDVLRWRAAGFLHDALRDADPAALRNGVGPEFEGWPGPLLHGPAAAAGLEADGVADGELLRAVAYHTVGHPDFAALGIALYCADFLDPGRSFREEWRRGLRSRLPEELEGVACEIVAARIRYLLEGGRRIFPSTIAFWNRFVGDEG